MVDTTAYKRYVTAGWDDFVLEQGTELPIEEPPNLSVEQLIICTHEIRGYALDIKRWGIFNIDCVDAMEFNSKAFHGLMFEESKKRLISSLVVQHGSGDDDFDDVIKGKGKGLIFLLYGPPGVGKTFTAGKRPEVPLLHVCAACGCIPVDPFPHTDCKTRGDRRSRQTTSIHHQLWRLDGPLYCPGDSVEKPSETGDELECDCVAGRGRCIHAKERKLQSSIE